MKTCRTEMYPTLCFSYEIEGEIIIVYEIPKLSLGIILSELNKIIPNLPSKKIIYRSSAGRYYQGLQVDYSEKCAYHIPLNEVVLDKALNRLRSFNQKISHTYWLN